MDGVCLQKTRFHANPAPGTEPCKWWAEPLSLHGPNPLFCSQSACSAWVFPVLPFLDCLDSLVDFKQGISLLKWVVSSSYFFLGLFCIRQGKKSLVNLEVLKERVGASRYKIGGLDSKPLVAQTLSFVGAWRVLAVLLATFYPFTSVAQIACLVGKCSATRYSVAAPPLGARHGLGGPHAPATPPLRWQRERCDRGLWEGCSCDTPATHSELRNEPRQGCTSYTVERDRGGCSVCPTKPAGSP